MQLSKDTWHYRNFQAWRRYSQSHRHSDLRHGRLVHDERGFPVRDENGEWITHPARQPDLCTYTRIVLLWGPLHRLFAWATDNPVKGTPVLSALIVLMVGTVINLLALVFPLELDAWWVPFAASAIFMVLLVVVLAGSAGIALLWEEIVKPWLKNRARKKAGEPKKEREPSIVLERVKAHKQKICPMIEFKDEE